MTGKQRDTKGKPSGTERDMQGTEMKTRGVSAGGKERETTHKETNRHDGRCREMTRNERTGHTWKNVRDMRGGGGLNGMEGTGPGHHGKREKDMKGKSRRKPVVRGQFRVMQGPCPDSEATQGGT